MRAALIASPVGRQAPLISHIGAIPALRYYCARATMNGEGIMRSGGINWMAVIAAAIAIYAIGFVMYAMMIPMDTYLAMAGLDAADQSVATSRMMYSPLMPILTAVFMAVLFKWGQVADAMMGTKWAIVVALASAVPATLYGWVYDAADTNLTMIDCAHLMLGHIAAGAILGGWK
jgi:hypothetical protein